MVVAFYSSIKFLGWVSTFIDEDCDIKKVFIFMLVSLIWIGLQNYDFPNDVYWRKKINEGQSNVYFIGGFRALLWHKWLFFDQTILLAWSQTANIPKKVKKKKLYHQASNASSLYYFPSKKPLSSFRSTFAFLYSLWFSLFILFIKLS